MDHHHDTDPRFGPLGEPLVRLPVGDAGVVDAIVQAVVESATAFVDPLPWDSPAMLVHVGLDAADRDMVDRLAESPDAMGFTVEVSAPQELPGHPVPALFGRSAPAESVGVMLVCEAWVSAADPNAGVGFADADELAAAAGPDGRAEVRMCQLVLRDGTTATRFQPRGGRWYPMDSAVEGRIHGMLRRAAGATTAEEPVDVDEVLRRAWLSNLCAWVAMVLISSEDPDDDRSGLARAVLEENGEAPADAMAEVLAELGAGAAPLAPPPVQWLLERAGRPWDDLLAEARTSFPPGGVRELLVLGDDRFDEDRRCFVLDHPMLPGRPLNVVFVALWNGVPGRITDLLDPAAPTADPAAADAAVFYSIWNVEPGARGMDGGRRLIEGAAEQLGVEFPELETFVTLSPVPGLRRWAEQGWTEELDADHPDLLHAAATYLTSVEDGRPVDAVAGFHLGNGARLFGLHRHADPSVRGEQRSFEVMANYRYAPEDRAANRSLLAQGAVATSPAVDDLR